MGVQDDLIAHPGFTNVITNLLRLSVHEVDNGDELSENDRWSMVQTEHSSAMLIMDIVQNFSKPGQQVLDPFARTIYSAKACQLVDKNRMFIGCDKRVGGLQKYMPSLVKVYASQLVNDVSDLTDDDLLKP